MAEYGEILPITEVRRNLLPLVKKIQKLQESIAITRNGRAAAVLLSIEEYEGLLETLEILSDPHTMMLLRKSIKNAKAGRWYSHEEVWGE